MNFRVLFIQHGLLVQQLAQYQNIAFDDTKEYFCASPFERENLRDPSYGFSEDEVKNTGLCRYDGLKNNDQRVLLIFPSWRNYLAVQSSAFERRHKSSFFKKTDYFKLYNGLINDPRLLAAAKEYRYRVIYLLHPIVSEQAGDFTRNDQVRIISSLEDPNYEKLLTEASLLLTDYSGVQFDFAYMYKPVVYFHPPQLPPSYKEASYKYDKHALGDIATGYDELVDLLIDYMKNDCALKPEYRERIDRFFYHHDFDNCARTYSAAIDYMRNNKIKTGRWKDLSGSLD
jgi:CDP-glycerol glycerophosphotransferase (TagB/SpsB family)